MKRRLGRLGVYGVLAVLAAGFLFPFYWVLMSSLKSRQCLAMAPPSYYPAEVETAARVEVKGEAVSGRGGSWLRLGSADLGRGGETAFYIAVQAGGAAARIEALDPKEVRPEGREAAMVFESVPVVRRLSDGEKGAVLAKRVFGQGAAATEVLFVARGRRGGGAGPGWATEVWVNTRCKTAHVLRPRWRNYVETLKGPEATIGAEGEAGFLLFMRNSLFIGVLAVIGQLLSSSMVAFAFARLRFRGSRALFVVLLATLMVPSQATLVPMFSIYKHLGWIDTFLPLIVPQFTAGAFNVFLLRQYMLTLPVELDEAAAIDGCGAWGTYRHVILPNCKAALIVVGLFTFVYAWEDVMGPLIYLDNPAYRTVTLGLEYFRSPYVDNRHLLMTGAVLAMAPVAVLFLLLQRYILSGIATTGMKG